MRAYDFEPHSSSLQGLAWKQDAKQSRESTRGIGGEGAGSVSARPDRHPIRLRNMLLFMA